METFKSEADINVISKMDQVVVVDIFTQWCSPCRAMSVILDEMEKEFSGKVKFCKIDVSDGPPQWVVDMKISSVPTILFIKDGEIKRKEIGFKDKLKLSVILDDLV